MKRIEEIRILVADIDAFRFATVGMLPEEDEKVWRLKQARLENLVREERRSQNDAEQKTG